MNDRSAGVTHGHEDQALFWGAVGLALLAAQLSLGCALSLGWP